MKVVIAGGGGRLGRRVVPWLAENGVIVRAPPRSEVDWTNAAQVRRVLTACDRVLFLASWTDVTGAQADPAACVRDTVKSIQTTLDVVQRLNARRGTVSVRYVSTDYVLALERGGQGAGWYAASKGVAEQLVLLDGGCVARLSFVTPEQTQAWAWVDDVCVANRCWVEDVASMVGRWVIDDDPEPVVNIGGSEPRTLAKMLESRFPDHPALNRRIRDKELLSRFSKGTRPWDTSWSDSE